MAGPSPLTPNPSPFIPSHLITKSSSLVQVQVHRLQVQVQFKSYSPQVSLSFDWPPKKRQNHLPHITWPPPQRGRSGDVGSSIAHSLSNPSPAYFHIIVHQPSASWDHWRAAHWTIQFVLPVLPPPQRNVCWNQKIRNTFYKCLWSIAAKYTTNKILGSLAIQR